LGYHRSQKGGSKGENVIRAQILHHQQMRYMKLNTIKDQTYYFNKREYSSATTDPYVLVVTLALRNYFHKLVATNAFHCTLICSHTIHTLAMI